MSERERIAARIRALRAKTVENGCTEAEAMAAAEKLAQLLTDYNMTLDEADLRASPFADHVHDAAGTVGLKLWKPAGAIAKLTNTRYWTGGRDAPTRITFVGLTHEVEIAAYLLAICERAMRTESAAIMRAVRNLPHIKQAARVMPFLDGMADRLAARILAMIPPQPPGKGLIVLRNALIAEELARRGVEIETGPAPRPMNWGAYSDGVRAGDGVALNPGVATTSAARALQ
ncbi:MAG: DUF2786 domain-containing protein [Alphaproteobacteria bacterium]|uniref:DUF7168 domain-containing protein n=1 Tax=Brevundimonas sp. TaxID=1871086 RepID=UPI0025C5635C|nr:DUF2786 domain-containing protein [Brevundimonas sp.]MBU4195680.1 DUF2786 domain-containing protein [Alphaproteobacteria bacterium]MCG2664999.1 DUF2786 domain-containing protein [Brevundimonas sp.]